MFYFKDYTDYFLNNFPDANNVSLKQIPFLFGKGLANKIVEKITTKKNKFANELFIRSSSSSLVSILAENETKTFSNYNKLIVNHLKTNQNLNLTSLFNTRYFHLSWLSLDINTDNNNLYSLLYKRMRSYDFLNLAEELSNESLLFSKIELIKRKNNKGIVVLLPDENTLTKTNYYREKLLKELHLTQPYEFLTIPPHISIARVNLKNSKDTFCENIESFELKVNISNLIILRHLNRIPDQPVFAVTNNTTPLTFN